MDRKHRKTALPIATLCCAIGLAPSLAQAQARHETVTISNVATQVADHEWLWTAYVSGPPQELGNIACVVYRLHPTFPDPIQTVCNANRPPYPFALSARGWGSFALVAHIQFTDGQSQDAVWMLDLNRRP